jgi:LuxR family transcriptional regulator, maltose regulon positive regulatory protein
MRHIGGSPDRKDQPGDMAAHRRTASEAVKRALIDAVDCEDWPLVVALTETNWTQLLAMHSGRLHRALRATPREHFAGNPLALMTRELFEIDLAAPAPLPRLLTEIERIAVGRSPHCRRALEMNLAALIASRRRGQYDAAIAYYNQLESIGRAVEPHRAAETDGLTSFILAQSGILFELAGDSEHASRLLREAYRWAPASELDVSAKHTAGRLAMSLARLGLLRQARHWLDTADDGVTWTGQTARNSQAVMGLADATIAIASLEHEQARSALDALGSTMLHDEYWPFFVEAQTEFVLTWGDDAAIAAQLSAVRSRTNTAGLRSDGNGIADPLLAAAEANLLIALGRGTEARAVLDAPIRQSPILDEPRARLALLTGENERAVVIARTAVDRPSLSPQLRLKLTLTLAVALYRLGDIAHAADALRRAVHQSNLLTVVAPFAWLPRADLRAIAARVPQALELLGDERIMHAGRAEAPAVTLVTLSRREQLILAELALGLSAQRIAETLRVSINTIRSQRRTIYQKLGANSRVEALGTAADLGLLESNTH